MFTLLIPVLLDMATGRRQRTVDRNYAESDEEDSNRSGDDDWIPEELHTSDNDTSIPDELDFSTTKGFSLRTVKNVKRSNHVIWNRFGQLMKNNKIVKRLIDRRYCITCFEKGNFKQ